MNKSLKKKLAAYFTKPAVSTLISSLLIDSPNVLIFDPSCGSGNLLKGAIDKIQHLTSSNDSNSVIVGVEVFNESFNQAKLLEREGSYKLDINIIQEDIFQIFEKLNMKYFLNNQDSSLNKNPNQFIVLANPPFSKSQNLSNEYKKAICNTLKLNSFISVGLHFYFINLILQVLPDEVKFGLILPITISYTNQGVELGKDFFVKTKIQYIIISEAETAFSIDSNFQEIIIIGQKNECRENYSNIITVISLKKELQIESSIFVSELIKKIFDTNINEYFSSYSIFQKELINKIGIEGWNFLYISKKLNSFIDLISKPLTPIGYEKNIIKKRGINVPTDFFFIPNKYYEIKSETEATIQIILRLSNRKHFDSKFSEINLPKKYLIPLIRKPEYYKNKIQITSERLKENYCLFINENNQDIELSKYIEFGEKILVHKRSNTSILLDKWFYASNSYSSKGNLYLTFKWDPRYRSFLLNYSQNCDTIAGQAFWTLGLKIPDQRYKQFLVGWINSTLSMGLIYNLADVQRRVWRQLAGNRINSILILPMKFFKSLTNGDLTIITAFNEKKFNDSLFTELEQALQSIQLGNYESNKRILVDLLFLNKLLPEEKENHLEIIKMFYQELKEELHKIAVI